MGPSLRLTSAEQVRAHIANLVLGDRPGDVALGDVVLQPHQVSAVSRIRMALREFGGALLCDEVGMGKTFVAAAIARDYSAPLVVAPAALAEMWKAALSAARVRAEFVSFEKLSRLPSDFVSRHKTSARAQPTHGVNREYDAVIIDEAHHARNHATRRYARLIELTRDARVLLLSATPIHNRRSEMSAVLSLFLGSRANALTPAELGRCVFRRGHAQLESGALMPTVLPVRMLRVSDDPRIVDGLMSFPDPVPVRDGGSGGSLIGRVLVHQWASSEEALRHALRRRAARAAALIASLEAGTYPTEQELRVWTFDDGALQLGFPELLSPKVEGTNALLDSVRLHTDALNAFRARYRNESQLDAERAQLMREIRRSHSGAKIVAFAQYTPTVMMLYRHLQRSGGVAMLTSRGAHVAGGKLSRRDALARFAPNALKALRPGRAEAIDLLLATDLLSEGVNLQDAQIVVHLDLPWTAARMEQRVGRVARMGSPHSVIHSYVIHPPASADALLRTEAHITRKWDIARRSVGSSISGPLGDPETAQKTFRPHSVSQLTESLRAILESWRRPESLDSLAAGNALVIAAVESANRGFLAVIAIDERPQLIASISGVVSSDLESQIAACGLSIGTDVRVRDDERRSALSELRQWVDAQSASAIAGTSRSKAFRRKRLVNRIDRAIETAPPHSRSRRLTVAARARDVVSSQQSAAIEAELTSLSDSDLADDEWLQAVASLKSEDRTNIPRAAIRDLRIHALLLLTALE